MVDDRNRGGGYYNRSEQQDYGRDYGSGRDYAYSSARDYAAAGQGSSDRDRSDRDRDDDRRPYGQRDYGNQGYADRDRMNRGQSYSASGGGYGGYMGGRDRDRDAGYQGDRSENRGSYASDGWRFTESDRDRNRGYGDRDRDDDRGFFARAGDEVRSWFGDDDAERRRDRDERTGASRVRGDWAGDPVHDHRDRDYNSWRQTQIADLDRDYDEYRRENQSKFHNEFSSWRTSRQGQRQMLNQVQEHAEVVGSDGEKVGTVDKVEGDRIKLTKNDAEAGGRHHSIPCGWLQSVEGNKVTLNKSSTEAKTMWRDEERQGTMFGKDDDASKRDKADEGVQARDNQGRMLNRSFSGTY